MNSENKNKTKFPITETDTWKKTILIVSGFVKDEKIEKKWGRKLSLFSS
jgi:hypothetical protein